MGLMNQVKLDVETITTNTDEFGLTLAFEAPTGETATIVGIAPDHSNDYDVNGNPVIGKFTHVTVSEQPLLDASYPTRDDDNLISFTDHLVTITYADGSTKQYIVDHVQPDYTINLINIILSDYDAAN